MEKEHVRELYEFYEEKMQQEIITDELLKLGRKIIIKTDEFNEELSKEQQEKLEELLELEHERGAALDTEVFISLEKACKLSITLSISSTLISFAIILPFLTIELVFK